MLLSWMIAGCALHSGLHIESGQSFQLGDNRHDAFVATVDNVGPIAVQVVVRKQGADTALQSLAPGERAVVRFVAGETAVFVNDSAIDADLSVRVRGDTGLSMGYMPLP